MRRDVRCIETTPLYGVMEVHHVETGRPDGPAVVLSGSLGYPLGVWDRQRPALEDGYRVVRYDLRGHGRSPVPDGPSTMDDLAGDLIGLLDRLEIERAALVGLSIGGMVSLAAAAAAPERLWALVPCCTGAYLPPREAWGERARLVEAEGTGAVVEGVLGRWFTPGFADRDPDAVAPARASLEATDRHGYASLCRAIEAMDLRPALAAITAPTLVISAALDPSIPPEHGRLVADDIRGARFAVIEDAAHLANVEQPEQFNRLLLDHLEAAA
jgi:3-oxoadipate enol-lactonase